MREKENFFNFEQELEANASELENLDAKEKKPSSETEINEDLSLPIEVFIPEWNGEKSYVCDMKFASSEQKNKVIAELNKELEKERASGRFNRTKGNVDGFNISFSVDGKKIRLSFMADLPNIATTDLTQEKSIPDNSSEEKKMYIKRHEDAHGLFDMDHDDLKKLGKDKDFVDEYINLLKKNNLWEKQVRHVLENWNLLSLGFTDSEEVVNIEKNINDLLKSESSNIDKIFSIIKDEFGQDQLDVFKKQIIVEIDGDAHGYRNKELINLMRQAKANVAGEDFLHRNAPMEA